jgi:Sulfotransferase domain
VQNLIETEGKSESEFLAAARMQSINDFNPDDIFVAGYPKSGNTWMQHLIAALIFGMDPRLALDSLVQNLVPDVYFTKFYKRYLTPTFFKTHDLPKPHHRRVIYLVRDGRDAMVSYFHHLAALGPSPDCLKLVATGDGLFPCRWHEHVEAWLENPYGAEMITVSYEMLSRDRITELGRICAFAGLERGQGTLSFVAQNCTFETMREKERKFGWANPDWPKAKAFVRRGKVGSYKDEMPPEILEAFLQISTPALKRMGYL